MSTHTAICYHIVFSTKDRAPVLKQERREDLFRYIWGIIKNRHSHLYRINSVEDHVHILSSLHPTVSLADFVKDIKTGSALWIKENSVLKGFRTGRRATPRSPARRATLMALSNISRDKKSIIARPRLRRSTGNCFWRRGYNSTNGTCSKGPIVRPLRGRDASFVDSFSVG